VLKVLSVGSTAVGAIEEPELFNEALFGFYRRDGNRRARFLP
jgi:hypothetical protein